MSKQQKTKLLKVLITAAAGMASVVFYALSRDFFQQELVEQYRILCDGFFLPGIFMVFFGLMFVMNNLGALDSITYLLKYAVRTFVPSAFGEMPKYLEYVEQRRENRVSGYGFLFWTGLFFLAIATVFLLLFYSVYG